MIPTLAGPGERKLRRELGAGVYAAARHPKLAAALHAQATARGGPRADADDVDVVAPLLAQPMQTRQTRREAIAQQHTQAEYYVNLSERVAAVREQLDAGFGADDDDAAVAGGRDDELERALAEEEDGADALLIAVPPLPGESAEAYRLRAARSRTDDLVASLHSDEDVILIAELNRWVARRSREAAEESRSGAGARALAHPTALAFAPDGEVRALLHAREEAQRAALVAFGASLGGLAERARARAAGALERAAEEAASSGASHPKAIAALVRASLRRSAPARAKHGGAAAAAGGATALDGRIETLLEAHKARTELLAAAEARQAALAAETREALAAAAELSAAVPVKEQRVRVLVADGDAHAAAAADSPAGPPAEPGAHGGRERLAWAARVSPAAVRAALAEQPPPPPPDASLPPALGDALRALAAAEREEADLKCELEALRAEAADDEWALDVDDEPARDADEHARITPAPSGGASASALPTPPRSVGATTPTAGGGGAQRTGAERALAELAAATRELRPVADAVDAALAQESTARNATADWAAARARLDAADPPAARARRQLAAEAARRSERALAPSARLAEAEAELAQLAAQLRAQQLRATASVAETDGDGGAAAEAAEAAEAERLAARAAGALRWLAVEHEATQLALADARAAAAECALTDAALAEGAARLDALRAAVDAFDPRLVARAQMRALLAAAADGERDDEALADDELRALREAALDGGAQGDVGGAALDARAGEAEPRPRPPAELAVARAGGDATPRRAESAAGARLAQTAAAEPATAAAVEAAASVESVSAAAAADVKTATTAAAEAAASVESVSAAAAADVDAADAADASEPLARAHYQRARLSARLLRRELEAERALTHADGMAAAHARASRIVTKLRVTVQAVDAAVVEAADRIGEIDSLKVPLADADPSWSEREQRYHTDALAAQAANAALLKRLLAVERQSGWWRARFLSFFADEIGAELAPLLAEGSALPDRGARVLELLPPLSIFESLEHDELIRSWRELASGFVPPTPVRPGLFQRGGGKLRDDPDGRLVDHEYTAGLARSRARLQSYARKGTRHESKQSASMPGSKDLNSHPKGYGKGSRQCRATGRKGGMGLIRKYGINMKRQVFREFAKDMGWEKYS